MLPSQLPPGQRDFTFAAYAVGSPGFSSRRSARYWLGCAPASRCRPWIRGVPVRSVPSGFGRSVEPESCPGQRPWLLQPAGNPVGPPGFGQHGWRLRPARSFHGYASRARPSGAVLTHVGPLAQRHGHDSQRALGCVYSRSRAEVPTMAANRPDALHALCMLALACASQSAMSSGDKQSLRAATRRHQGHHAWHRDTGSRQREGRRAGGCRQCRG